jgi:hypothetical protein
MGNSGLLPAIRRIRYFNLGELSFRTCHDAGGSVGRMRREHPLEPGEETKTVHHTIYLDYSKQVLNTYGF